MDVDRAAGEDVALTEKVGQEFAPLSPTVQGVDNDGCVQKVYRHYWLPRRRSAFSSVARIFSTHAAAPCFSSGWSSGFQSGSELPTASAGAAA
jgi:hypothetical protein